MTIDQARWKTAYLAEIDRVGHLTEGRRLQSVFFGGGTPSLMNPDTVAAILDRIRATWSVANDWEVTLEANPGSVEATRFRGYRDAGVNRISMGIQALNDNDLKRLGRLHSVAEAKAAFDIARHLYDRVSFDLIYARQDQPLAAWETELRGALRMAIDHLSLYQLTVEEGTAFADRLAGGGLRGLPDEDLSADLFLRTHEICDAEGFSAYEVSNHARAGAQSQHNLIYWRGGDYAGIGPGAHGRLTLRGTRFATAGHRQPGAWLHAVEQQRNGDATFLPISPADHATERVMMGLRLTEGMLVDELPTDANTEAITSMRDDGFVWQTGGRLGATLEGMPVLNQIIRRILSA